MPYLASARGKDRGVQSRDGRGSPRKRARWGADLSVIVTAFENLRTAGKIRAWGVSNFSVSDMEELFHIPHGDRQVPYNIGDRRIENDLLP
jgi:diketogulonate reductase-like aldo/keto reductase